MKTITFIYKSLLLIVVLFPFQGFAQNLIVNGDFQGGVSGFNIPGSGYTQITMPFSGTTVQGNFAITTNPQPMNTAFFIAGGDHTSGSGNMMVIDGNNVGGQQVFWQCVNAGGGICGLTVGSTYTFSYWIKSVSTTTTNAATQADIGVQIVNAGTINLISGNTLAPLPASGWQQVVYTFVPTNNCVFIKLYNNNLNAVGNDFAIDDMVVLPPVSPLTISHSSTNPVCTGNNNGSIVGYAYGGTIPYTFSLTGTSTANNTTGIFNGLAPGTYAISVTDNAGITVGQSNIVLTVQSGTLTTSSNTNICRGIPTTLSVSGGSSGYNWTASPADSTLTTPTSSNPTVSPTLTTTYTVSSTRTSNVDLITNGSFTNGNAGFYTDYIYYNPTNVNSLQRAYGVASNSNVWESGFTACVDHTTGTGQMMVVDGSNLNGGNDLVWGQNVAVLPGQNYTLSFWVQSVVGTSPAVIRVVINGVQLGTLIAGPTCTWINFSQTWNSGAATSAQIQLFDTNQAADGNDFALDDITFTTNIICNVSASVQIGVNVCTATVCPTPVVSVTQQPTCAVPTGTITFTSPLNPCALTQPTDLFISEVTDESTGALSYIEIFNGTGTPKNLANYKLKIYNNGNPGPSLNCDFPLSGTLNSGEVYVVSVGTVVNAGGVVPDLVVAICPGFNTNDNVRLTTIADVEIDLWGRTDGVDFTPGNQSGYTYRRNVCAPHPSLAWTPADWAALDPQDYTDVGNYQMAIYEYSVNGTTYQSSPTFTGLAPNTYNVTIRDLISGCSSTPIGLTINPITAVGPPTVSPITYCQNAAAVPLTATPSAGGTLNWYGTNATGGTASGTAPTPSTTGAPGSVVHYYVSQTVGGCESTRADIAVTIGNPPNAAPFLFCTVLSPTSLYFDFNNVGNLTVNYSYTIDGGPPITGTYNPFVLPFSNYTVSGLTQGQVVVFTLTWNGICTPPLTTTCSTPCTTTPVLTITNPAAVCSPGTVNITAPAVTAGSTGGGTLSYWTDAAATSGMTLAQASAIATSGTYYIKSSLGNCSDIEPVTVTITTPPVLVITNPAAVCAPNTVDISLPAVTAGSTGGGTLSYWINAAATTALANYTAILSSGTFYIKSTVGSCSDIEPVTVVVNPTPVLVITNPAAVCSPGTVDITSAAVTAGSLGAGTLSYWTDAAATSGLTLAQASAIATSGTYYIKSTIGACSDIRPVVVTINPTPSLTITNPAAVCSPNTVNITLPAVTAGSTGGGTLSYWTDAAATSGMTIAQASAIATSGTYYIKSTTAGNCSDIKPVTVTINPTPVLSITNPAAVCSPNMVNITLPAVTAGSTGGGTLSYWTDAAATSGLTLAQASAIATSGTYYIKSLLGGCSDINPVVVTINPTPSLTITNPAAVCSPNTVNITLPAVTAGSTGGGTLSYWTDAAATSGMTIAQASAIATSGTYYIKSTTAGNCSDIKPVTVTINPTPVLSITNPAAVCSPGTVDITTAAVTAGSTGGGILSYWTNAAATTALTNTTTIATSGTYYIKSTLGSCSDIEPVIVTVNNPNLIITNPLAVCAPATVDITLPAVTAGSTGGGILSYWTDAAATTGMTIAQASAINVSGTYYIKSTVGTCFDIEAVVVTITANFVVNNPLPLQRCDPNNDGFETFDLTQTINSITGGNPGYNVSFHETNVDANTGATAILTPASYDNINPFLQTIYVRVASNTSTCYRVVTLQLIINPTPVATEPDDYELCDYTGAAGYETFDLTSTISDILGTINPLTHTITFYTTQAAAELGTGNITNPTSYTNGTINTQTIYVRVETTATGCYDIVTLQLIVNPLPNATQPNYPQYSLCDTTGLVGFETFDLASQVNAILLGQTGMAVTFYPSLGEAQSNSNAITNLQYTNAVIYVQTLGVRITNTDTDCYVISTIDIRVEPLPVLIPPTQPYTICDDNQDGYSCGFDLSSLEANLLGSAPGSANYTLSFYETLADAISENVITAIDTTVPYCTINPFVQILYVRAEDNITHCYSILPIELNADPSPIAPVNLDPITVCDQDSSPQSASTLVDLTQATAAVLAQQTGAPSDYTVEYYTSQPLAEQGTLPIVNDTGYDVSDGTTIWVRVEHNTTGCYNVGSFQIEINTPLLLTTPTPLSVCDADDVPNDQLYVFDLTIKNTEINQATGYTVTYYPSLLDAQNDTNVITTPTAYLIQNPPVQTLGVVVTTADGCTSITTLDIRVLSIPTPNRNPTPLAPKCDDNNPGDMMEVFDLTVNEAYIGNGDPNLTFHYFATRDNAVDNVSELIPATAALVGDNVWIRVENNRVDYQGENCYVIVEQALTVNPLPIVVQPLAPYRACDDNADGIAVFDLTNPDLAEAILGPTQLPADYAISYHPSQAAATAGTPTLPNSYTNVTPNAQDIYVRVVNNATSCVNTGVLPLVVEAYARAVGPQQFNECDNDGNPYDGVGLVDLTSYAADILDGQDAAIFIVSYYTSLANAVAGTNALTLAQAQAYQTDADTDTIWVKVENSSNLITPVCYAITTIDIKVERYPNPVINTANNVTTICVDFITNQVVRPLTLNSGVVNPNNYTYEWFEDASTTPIPGATGPTYTVDTPAVAGATREYTVRVTSASPLACQTTSASFPVIQSGQAVIAAGTVGYTVTGAFSSSQIITVTVEGYGAPDYQYSLDDGPRQDSNVFEGVSMGTHIIHVWDAKGDIAYSCEELIINEVYIIDYPHYFTPNGDGIHDTWNVVGLDESAKIFIFDRYGKLLKQISPTGQGWNGTYNGHLLPSDDYWFTVDFVEGGVMKQFKSHFAMKR
ncbi:T9SS type B sorting domain-containing protein [Flavobacterium sangjuense]|uniref:LTD domain-containing protein n=1 Tax=Flavobacterium sangjuense TaxID=2518177 RepID=A0A4P7PWN5_9FLAO|nr:T9SS type B sorting domain-containing protein [Flavobacterium sangjuense]QBZ98742.1 hypothetical protein GS03_02253 [Flavobacterium sangjuense]